MHTTLPMLALSVNEAISPHMGVFFVAFAVSFLLTPLMRELALRNGVVDWPDQKRKTHLEPIPYLGGVALFLGWIAGIFLCFFLPAAEAGSPLATLHVKFPIPIIFGATVITLTGLLDDVYGISPRIKIGGQILAAAAMAVQSDVGSRLVQDVLATAGMSLPPMLAYYLGTLLLAVFIVGACNAFNLLDGLDGLAAGTAGIASLGFLFIAIVVNVTLLPQASLDDQMAGVIRVVMCLALLGTVMGYLPFNFNPANVFMGDAGSLLLGYLCISTVLQFIRVPHSGPLLVMAALIVFALPITDTTLAIFRRRLQGKPIFSPDNQHLHHQLLRAGLGVKNAVLTLYAIALGFAVLGGALVFLRTRYVLAVFLVFFAFIVVSAYKAAHRQMLKQAQTLAPVAPLPPAPSASETASVPVSKP